MKQFIKVKSWGKFFSHGTTDIDTDSPGTAVLMQKHIPKTDGTSHDSTIIWQSLDGAEPRK